MGRKERDFAQSVTDIVRRHARDAAFPGKAARFLGRLAVKFRGQEVSREAALEALKDAAQAYLEVLSENGQDIPTDHAGRWH